MNERDMFELSFKRPMNYFKLSVQEQYSIDAKLGILDWKGTNLSKKDIQRYKEYYDK